MIKRLLLVASTDKRLEKLVSTSRLTRGLVSRFVAGTTLADAIAVTRELQAQNIDVSLDLLGETVDDLAESAIATKAYIEAVRAIAENRLGATVSVKLSQLGIAVDPTVCASHLDDLLQTATAAIREERTDHCGRLLRVCAGGNRAITPLLETAGRPDQNAAVAVFEQRGNAGALRAHIERTP